MSAGKKIWYMESVGQYKEFKSVGEAARELELVTNALGKAISRKKFNPMAPVVHNGHTFYQVNPHLRPVYVDRSARTDGPLIATPVTHPIGAWR